MRTPTEVAGYRDAGDSLRARSQELGRELHELGGSAPRGPLAEAESLARSAARIDALEREIEVARRRLLRRGTGLRWGIAALGVAGAIVGMLAIARAELARAELYAALQREPWASVPVARRSANPRWRGTIVSATDRRARIGSACVVAARLETTSVGVVRTRLRLDCDDGTRVAPTPVDGCAVHERPAGEGAFAYGLVCRTPGLRVDTPRHTVHLERADGSWVQVEVAAASDPRAGPPLYPPRPPLGTRAFARTVRRVGHVARALGRSGVHEGDRCAVTIAPVPFDGRVNCRVLVRCGAFLPFGGWSGRHGYQLCDVRDGRPVAAFDGRAGTGDDHPTHLPSGEEASDGDPLLSLDVDHGRLTVGDDVGEYVVEVALDRAAPGAATRRGLAPRTADAETPRRTID